MKDTLFFKQAELILRVIPHVAAETAFALKGGTAINLFVRDMPRLSVDIDLTYLPIEPRDTSLQNISNGLQRIAHSIRRAIPGARARESYGKESGNVLKLFVSTPNVQIKIEPNTTIRGTVFPPAERDLCQKAEEFFELSASIHTLSLADLYGGKMCAALDRQHPRDLFDIKVLLDHEGITDEIRRAFVA